MAQVGQIRLRSTVQTISRCFLWRGHSSGLSLPFDDRWEGVYGRPRLSFSALNLLTWPPGSLSFSWELMELLVIFERLC
jgi:hypothetical protein